jgi:hypothetical protein
MGARDSDDDIRKYIADVDSIVKGADPARRKEQLRRAQDNPELDQALEELNDGLKDGESPFAFPIVHLRPKGQVGPDAKAGSPWASEAPEIERGALPSSLGPNAAPPVTTPIPPEPVKPARGKRRALPSWRVGALAVLAALSPVTIVLIFLRLHAPVVTAPSVPSASAQASAPSIATASASPQAPAATVAPSAELPQPAVPSVDAGQPALSPTSPAASATVPRAPLRPPPTPRPVATDIAP